MPNATTTVENTTEEFLVPLKVWAPLVPLLALAGGVAAGMVASHVRFPDGAPAATKLVPFTLTIAGLLLGAGLALLLADLRTTRTTKTTTSAAGGEEGVTGPLDVVTESVKVLKDLSAGKTLLVLAIVLIILAMWTAGGKA